MALQTVKLRIYAGSVLVFTTDFDASLQLGRQSDNNEQKYTQAGTRVVIAAIDETDISRRHMLIENIGGGRVKVTNMSAINDIAYGTADAISPKSERELPLPAVLSIADRVIELGLHSDTGSVNSVFDSLPHSPTPPGQATTAGSTIHDMLSRRSEQETEFLLKGLHAISSVNQQAAVPQEYYDGAVGGMVDVVGLDTAAVLMWRDGNWDVAALKVAGDSASDASRWSPSRTVLNQVRENKRTFWEVPSFSGASAPSLVDVRALIAAPLLDSDGNVIGALYGDRRCAPQDGKAEVSEVEAILVEVLSSGVASGLSRLRYQRAATDARVLFEQFFTPELSAELESNPALLVGKDVEISLLICEIRGFSEFAEKPGARLTLDWINDVMGTLSNCISKSDGTIVDMMGDEIVGMWGAPKQCDQHAQLACTAAIQMFEQLPALNRRWQTALDKPMDLGIGIHTGVARVGNIGSEKKFKYGPLGSTVRVAIQTQRTTRRLGTKILLTDATASQLDDSFPIRYLSRMRDKQTDRSFDMCQLMPTPPADWEELKRRYETAATAFYKGDYPTAISLLGKVLAEHPGDRPSLQLMTRINQKLTPKPWSL